MKDYLGILRRNDRPLRFVAARVLTKTGLCRLLTIPQDGYRLRYYPSNLSEQTWIDRDFRIPALEFFHAYVQPGDHVVDVGANVGDTALTCALRAGPSGHVWAVEAHPRTYAFLCGNLRLNRAATITPINFAVGDEEGSIAFEDNRRDDMNRVGQNGIEVPLRLLDTLIPHDGRIDLLKIDVEGFELPVLRGAAAMLARTGAVFIEVGEELYRNFGYGSADVLGVLEQSGFVLLNRADDIVRRVTRDFVADRVVDVIAVRDPADFTRRTGWPLA